MADDPNVGWETGDNWQTVPAENRHPNKQQNVGESRTEHFNDGYSDSTEDRELQARMFMTNAVGNPEGPLVEKRNWRGFPVEG
jgi:hypothetical protein